MDPSVSTFYDGLSNTYHLLFEDWAQSIRLQGPILDRLLAAHLGPGPHAVLDCCCGIGTQAIGLALLGHRVVGTDLSSEAIARAAREAPAFGVSIPFTVADVRELTSKVADTFDVIIACDNALPHLTEDAELLQAVREMAGKLRPGACSSPVPATTTRSSVSARRRPRCAYMGRLPTAGRSSRCGTGRPTGAPTG